MHAVGKVGATLLYFGAWGWVRAHMHVGPVNHWADGSVVGSHGRSIGLSGFGELSALVRPQGQV